MRRTLISIRSIAEFVGFIVIIVGGGVGTTLVSERFTTPGREIVSGLVLITLAIAGFWWLVTVGPESDVGRSSSLAGLGGALGVLVVDSFVSGSQYVAIGAAIGAGVCATIGVIWVRRPPVRNDLKVHLPTTDNTRKGLLITAMFGLGMAVGILLGNAENVTPLVSAGIIIASSLIGILIGIGLFNRRMIGENEGYRIIDLTGVFE